MNDQKKLFEEIHERKHELNIVLIDSTLKEHPLPRTKFILFMDELL